MGIENLKFKESDFIGQDVASLPDTISGDAEFLKNRFDNIAKNMIALGRWNELIDYLASNGENLSADGGKISGNLEIEGSTKAADVSTNNLVVGGCLTTNEIQPSETEVYDVGSLDNRYNNLYGMRYYGNKYYLGENDLNYIKLGTGTDSSGTKMGVGIDCNKGAATLELTLLNNVWSVVPWRSDGSNITLGTTNYKWGQIYSKNAAISTSDRNEKNSIEDIDEQKAAEFILAHRPVSFKFNEGTSGRTHYGLIAQDVEDVLEKLNISSQDFAGFIKEGRSRRVKTGEDEQGNPIYDFENVEGEYVYGLRYEEYIAPLMACVKMLLKEREENEKRFSLLEERLAVIEKEAEI